MINFDASLMDFSGAVYEEEASLPWPCKCKRAEDAVMSTLTLNEEFDYRILI